MTQETSERFQFSVDPFLLTNVVLQQASSLERAVAEAVMNSIDAGASAIDITLTAGPHGDMRGGTLRIRDNGKGMQTDEEIKSYFAVFGFDHNSEKERGKRRFGRYGVGRAQLFAHARQEWRTGSFCLDVDVKTHGFDYGVTALPERVEGLEIVASLYGEPLVEGARAERTLAQVSAELHKGFRYAPAKITLNGKALSVAVETQTWDFEDEVAYYLLKPGSELRLYHQGILISENYSEDGGEVVSKVALGVNLVRNQAHGDGMRHIRHTLRRLWRERRGDKRKLTTTDRRRMIRDLRAGELDWAAVQDRPMFALLSGEFLSLNGLLGILPRDVVAATHANDHWTDKAAQHNPKLLALGHAALQVLDAGNASGFGRVLLDVVERAPEAQRGAWRRAVGQTRWLDDPRSAVPGISAWKRTVPASDHTAQERAALAALRAMNEAMRGCALTTEWGKEGIALRDIHIGETPPQRGGAAVAWTDGRTTIAFNREQLRRRADLRTFGTQAHVLLHEYMHATDTENDHVHDETFYRRYHDRSMRMDTLRVTRAGVRAYVLALVKEGLKIPPPLVQFAAFPPGQAARVEAARERLAEKQRKREARERERQAERQRAREAHERMSAAG